MVNKPEKSGLTVFLGGALGGRGVGLISHDMLRPFNSHLQPDI